MYSVPEKLREFRKAKGFSQKALAEMLNMEQTTYGKIELGKNSLRFETAMALSTILEKEITQFTTIHSATNNTVSYSNVTVNSDVNFSNHNNTISEIIQSFDKLVFLFDEFLKGNNAK